MHTRTTSANRSPEHSRAAFVLPGGKTERCRRAARTLAVSGPSGVDMKRSGGSFPQDVSPPAKAPVRLPHTDAPRPEPNTESAQGDAVARHRPHTASCRSRFRFSLGNGTDRPLFRISRNPDFPTHRSRLFTSLGGETDGPFFRPRKEVGGTARSTIFPTRQPCLLPSLGGGADGPFSSVRIRPNLAQTLRSPVTSSSRPASSAFHLPGGRAGGPFSESRRPSAGAPN